MRKRGAAATKMAEDGDMSVVDKITAGDLPVVPALRALPSVLSALAARGYSQDEIHALIVPKRTLARRRDRGEPLSVDETDKALRLERIAALAEKVFGAREKAWAWLRKSKAALGDKTPVAFLGSEAGARLVEDMLHRIDHGILA